MENKGNNKAFAAFAKFFTKIGRKWASYMSRKEEGVSNTKKKMLLLGFVVVMLSLLWLPFFFSKNKGAPDTINIGSSRGPVSLDRTNYRNEAQRLDSLILYARQDSARWADSLLKLNKLPADKNIKP